MTQANETSGREGNDRRFARFVTVSPPAAHEGIGRALRETYIPGATLPADILSLLDRLDRA
jgi:hypothetical protein